MLDLAKLTEFNHALVYGFEPESSPNRLAGSEALEDGLFPRSWSTSRYVKCLSLCPRNQFVTAKSYNFV